MDLVFAVQVIDFLKGYFPIPSYSLKEVIDHTADRRQPKCRCQPAARRKEILGMTSDLKSEHGLSAKTSGGHSMGSGAPVTQAEETGCSSNI